MNDIVRKQMYRNKYTRNTNGVSHENITLYLVDYDNYSVEVNMYGAYPLSFLNENSLIRDCANLLSMKNDKGILFTYKNEPYTMATYKHIYNEDCYTWFDFFHNFSKKYNIDPGKISFMSANYLLKNSYDLWCEQNNIYQKINVLFHGDSYWTKKWLYNHLKYIKVNKTKKISMMVGKPRLHKNYFIKWYIDNILNTDNEKDFIISCIYGNFNNSHYNIDEKYIDKFKLLPGMLEDTNVKDWNQKTRNWIPKNLSNNFLSKKINQSLMFFILDFNNLEDFSSIEDYELFVSKNSWWQEDQISEKTYLPIILKMPFLRLGMPGSLKYLRSLGYKTFDGILFDESYDNIDNFEERFNFIIDQVNNILETPFDFLKEKFLSKEVQDIVEHNHILCLEKCKNMETINV